MQKQEIFETYESEVRSYCRSFPSVFQKAKGSVITDIDGKHYLDFFCGAGAVNYGHNNDYIKEKLISYMQNDGILHALDMMTDAKADFIEYFEEHILNPRGFQYKIMFTGPTGTNAMEAALKLARKVKKRENIWALMGCFHGMTLASLALTSDRDSRKGAGVPLCNVTHIPAPYMFDTLDTIQYMETIITDDHSGIEKPSALVIETVQAEGGIHVFSVEWLKQVRAFCDKHDILLIVDDIQVGCARTGTFFSFERADIIPDMVILSKSIGGYGFPFALTLFKPDLDIWTPGEHNGTFRGNQLAMIAGKAGLEYMLNQHMEQEVCRKEALVKEYMEQYIKPQNLPFRGIGLIWGIDIKNGATALAVTKTCFEKGLIIERAGRDNSVVKLMPALTIPDAQLIQGLDIIRDSIAQVTAIS